jgi:hypothetical protein
MEHKILMAVGAIIYVAQDVDLIDLYSDIYCVIEDVFTQLGLTDSEQTAVRENQLVIEVIEEDEDEDEEEEEE